MACRYMVIKLPTQPVAQQALVISDLLEQLALVQGLEGDVLGGGPDCKDRSRLVDVKTDSWLVGLQGGHAGLLADVPDLVHEGYLPFNLDKYDIP